MPDPGPLPEGDNDVGNLIICGDINVPNPEKVIAALSGTGSPATGPTPAPGGTALEPVVPPPAQNTPPTATENQPVSQAATTANQPTASTGVSPAKDGRTSPVPASTSPKGWATTLGKAALYTALAIGGGGVTAVAPWLWQKLTAPPAVAPATPAAGYRVGIQKFTPTADELKGIK